LTAPRAASAVQWVSGLQEQPVQSVQTVF
jgi:hypothetical protein